MRRRPMMRWLRWLVIGMTATTIGFTLWEAAYGTNLGLVLYGLGVAVLGVFLVALWQTE